MKLVINGLEVHLRKLRLVEGALILQVLFPQKGDLCVHQTLVDALINRRHPLGGVMSVETFEPHENRPNESEIRVLDGYELEIIDLARMSGYGVHQEHDDEH